MHSKSILRVLVFVAACLACFYVRAQTYPDRPVRFIVPYTPGGLPDVVARLLAQRLGESMHQPIVIENKPGAVGSVAAVALSAAPADGYTFMLTDTAMLTVGPLLGRSLPFDPKRDFAPVSLLGNSPLYLAVNPHVPANTLDEFVAYAKAKAGGVNYASSGPGSIHHLAAEALGAAMRVPLNHVPYKGSGPSVAALVGGQVDMVFTAYSNIAAFAKGGQLKVLAASTARRSPLTPAIPALGESIPGYDYSVTLAVFAGAGTPESAISRMSAELASAIKHPDIQARFTGLGMMPVGAGPAELAHALKDEFARMVELFKTARISVD